MTHLPIQPLLNPSSITKAPFSLFLFSFFPCCTLPFSLSFPFFLFLLLGSPFISSIGAEWISNNVSYSHIPIATALLANALRQGLEYYISPNPAQIVNPLWLRKPIWCLPKTRSNIYSVEIYLSFR